jgi:hypothetical protein
MARLLGLLTLVLSASLIAPSDAQAYLDPGTGSYLIQAVVAVVMGGVFTLKLYWSKVKSFFKSGSANEAKDE